MKRLIYKVLALILIVIFMLPGAESVYAAYPGLINTVAGTGDSGYSGDGGEATSAWLNCPNGVAVDSGGNIYITDIFNHRIRKVDTNGIISTVAGTGKYGYSGDGGEATSAQLYHPVGVVVDSGGNIYIADADNNRVRKVDTNGIISTVAGTEDSGYNGDGIAATSAQLDLPSGVAVDSGGNIYIADTNNKRIRKVDTNGIISTVAGTGGCGYNGDEIAAISAQLDSPFGVAVDSGGNIYIADTGNHRIRKVDTDGIISTVAGTGKYGYSGDGEEATSAQLYHPWGVAVDSGGNIYIADMSNHRIRKVDTNRKISTVAGTGDSGYNGDEIAAFARLDEPCGVAVDSNGNIYIADTGNQRVHKVGGQPVFHSVQISGTIPTLIAGEAGYDLSNLTVAGRDQYDTPYDISGETVTWAVSSGSSYADINGSILNPLSAGSGTVTATVNGVTSDPVSFTVDSSVTITTGNLTGVIGIPYKAQLEAIGGTTPYTWNVDGLPAELKLNGTTGVISGTPEDTGTLDLTVTVTDNNLKKDTKKITLTIAQSLSIDLVNLTVNPGTLSPAFDKNTVAYKVQGIDNLESIDIAAESVNPSSTITINDETRTGSAVETVTLNNGENLIPIVVTAVTAQDGTTERAYILSVNGTVSDADLDSLTLSTESESWMLIEDGAGTGSAIGSDKYYVNVGNNTETIDIVATPSDSKALVLIDGSVRTNSAIELDVGENPIDVMVVAQDATTKNYTVTVNRGKGNVNLSDITLSHGTLSPAFSKTKTQYTATVPYTTETIRVTPTLADSRATVKVNGKDQSELVSLEVGKNTIEVVVKGKDGVSTKTYTITVIRKEELICGKGAYIIKPNKEDSVYKGGYTNGIPTMEVNEGVSGFTYFSVTIKPVTGHSGNEVCVFIHMRNGKQMGVVANKVDFDQFNNTQAAFNVKAGDIIKAYIVDDLSNDLDTNPNVL